MKVVIDTNILISGLFWSGAPKNVLDLLDEEKITAYATWEIMQEYEEIIHRHSKKSSFDSNLIFSALAGKFRLVLPVKLDQQICDDPDDDMFIACALAAKANYIISGDKKLLQTNDVLPFDVVTAAKFLKEMKP